MRLHRGQNECGILSQPVAALVSNSPSPPPSPAPPSPSPSPRPPSPSPSPPAPAWMCPPDAVAHNHTTTAECQWVNGSSASWRMPPVVGEYCDYISAGYFGYTYLTKDYSPTDFPCPPSADLGSNGAGDNFCTISSGRDGVKLPAGARADCKDITRGMFGYVWSV